MNETQNYDELLHKPKCTFNLFWTEFTITAVFFKNKNVMEFFYYLQNNLCMYNLIGLLYGISLYYNYEN